MKISRPFLASALALLLVAKVALQLLVLRAGFLGVSADDFLRDLIAARWAGAPFFAATDLGPASVLWMPLHFWLTGAATYLTGEVWLGPILVSFVFSLVAFALVWALSAQLSGSGFAPLIAAWLALLLPWQIWLGVSGISDPLYQSFALGAFVLLLRWAAGDGISPAPLVGASVCLTLSAMVRPEGWLLAGAFAVFLGWRFVRARGAMRPWIALAALLPWLFVLYWLYHNYRLFGNPLQILSLSKAANASEAGAFTSLPVRAIQYPAIMFLASPALCLLLAWACWRDGVRWLKSRGHAQYLALLGLAFLALIGAGVLGLGTKTAPQRFTILYLLLGIPLVADALARRFAAGGRARAISLAVLLAVGAWQCAGIFRFPVSFPLDAEAGRLLRGQIEAGALPPGTQICTERGMRLWRGIPYATPHDEAMALCADWAVRTFSNAPERFPYDISQDMTPARHAELGPAVAKAFADGTVGAIFSRSPEVSREIPAGFQLAGHAGDQLLFLKEGLNLASGSTPTRAPWREVEAKPGAAPVLAACAWGPGPFQEFVRLRWAAPAEGVAGERELRVSYRRAGREVYSEKVDPFHGLRPVSAWPRGENVEQVIVFPPTRVLPPGRYKVAVGWVSPGAPGAAETAQELPGELLHAESKREVLKAFATGQDRDFGFLWLTLLHL